ncbi:MAG: lysoplasmalogenase [Anaerolineae bacterium]|nr:lysoplasmalogenase [Anaerolineae bacterium]
MLHTLAIGLVIVFLVMLLREDSQPKTPISLRKRVFWKGGATFFAFLLAMLTFAQPGTGNHLPYTLLIGGGLILSLIGDVALVYDQPRAFLLGMVAFALAHISYILAFLAAQTYLTVTSNIWRDLGSAAALFGLAFLVYRYLRPHLGDLNKPVLLYIAIISLMLHRAISSADYGAGVPLQPVLALAGATLFYVSDFILAINKFVFEADTVPDHALVLGFYYAAQVLLALSTSFL